MYYNEPDKPILVLNEKSFLEAIDLGSKNLRIVWNMAPASFENRNLYPTEVDIANELNKNIEKTIKPKAQLYFTKNSKIPRFKLQETEYKRVIKPEKADYIVINEIPNIEIIEKYAVFKNDCALFFIKSSIIDSYAEGKIDVFLDKLASINNRSNFDATPIYEGKLNKVRSSQAFIFDVYNKYLTKKIVLDETLNKILDKQFSELTEEDFKTIYSMLNSSDVSSVEMGLKLLSNTNISETPYLIYSILNETYQRWRYNDAKNSVSVKNMFEALDFNDCYRSNDLNLYYYIYNNVKKKFKKEPKDSEVELIKKYFTNSEADAMIRSFNNSICDNNNPLFPKIIISSE